MTTLAPRSFHCLRLRRSCVWYAALLALIVAVAAPLARAGELQFPETPPHPATRSSDLLRRSQTGDEQMLVRANEIHYDYNNERVSAVGNVQIYYAGATLQADRVIYDQRSKRLYAEGSVHLVEADGNVINGAIVNLRDDFRDGFIDSLRLETPERAHFAAQRATRSRDRYTVFENGVYTACQPCKDNPSKPPLWQIKSARIIHDQEERVIYFEDARLEFFGVPLAYVPFMSMADPTVKRKSGILTPSFALSTKFGEAVTIPYYWAIAPNYDLTFMPMITRRQGPLLEAEWRHRLVNGSYQIRAAGIFQLNKQDFLRTSGVPTPGYRDWRGAVSTSGQFTLGKKWVWGWDALLVSDIAFMDDYNVVRRTGLNQAAISEQRQGVSQLYLAGRGNHSYFVGRVVHYNGFSEADVQQQLPIIHPVIDHYYSVDRPLMGGTLNIRSNFTSLSRSQASFDPITPAAASMGLCLPTTPFPAITINPTNCLMRGIPGTYSRFSAEVEWRRTFIDAAGQVITPFFSLRGDVAAMGITGQPGVSNYIAPGSRSVGRIMPAVGVEYRYPLVNAQPWGTQTIEPIVQVIARPDEPNIVSFPNEDAQSLVFDDTNIFRVNKFSGWDRVEGGGRANVGIQYTAQFNKGGFFNAMLGQSHQLFGKNSFAIGGPTNTGLATGLETAHSDYVARVAFQPNRSVMFVSRFRFDESDYTLRRLELEASTSYGRWSASVLYGDYDAQPQLGFLTRRQGIAGTGSLRLTRNWSVSGSARYDIDAAKLNETQFGVSYVDDCLILALNYITSYAYSGNPKPEHAITLQLSLRTLGASAVSQNVGSPLQ